MNTTTHYEQLENWLNNTLSYIGSDSISSLRKILGEIMKNVNNASDVFYQANHNPLQHRENIQKTIIDVVNYNKIKELFPKIEAKISSSVNNNVKPIINMLHTLEHSSFTEQQISQFESLLNHTERESESDFPENVNLEGLNQFTKGSIYNLKNESEKTLKAIREILQNAVDATDPKQHPSLLTKENFKPEIKITTHHYSGNTEMMDLIIHDQGIGMNWDVLSKKFFVTFGSGKKDSPGATGGFGVAKVIIQNAPEDGWSIDTNSLHSSKFHKNIYLGSRKSANYIAPTSKITSNGTTLSLFGVPYAASYEIEELCEVYATNGRVKIILDDNEIKPKFTLQDKDVVSINSNINQLPDLIGNNDTEKDIAKSTFNKEYKSNLDDDVRNFANLSSAKGIKVNLYIKKHIGYSSGSLYIMLNGQYQFHQPKWLNRIDIICSIETNIRPGDENYPLDPGRDNIRGEFKDQVEKIVQMIKSFTDKVKENDLFKKGIESSIVNSEADPLSSKISPEQKTRLNSALHANLSSTMEQDPEEKAREIIKSTIDIVKNNDIKINQSQEEIAVKKVAEIIRSTDNRIEQKEKIDKVINGLQSPAAIMIQKNFIAKSSIMEENFHLNDEILILWQNSVKILIDKIGEFITDASRKVFIPGLIYSDECLGLYMPEKKSEGREYPSISINPVTIAAAIQHKYFQENFEDKVDSEAFSHQVKKKETYEDGEGISASAASDANKLTHNVAKIIFHIGIHEITHLLFPDGYGHERFHNKITYLELYCHDSFEQIKKEAKAIMPKLKISALKLLKILVKERKKAGITSKMEHLHYKPNNSFFEWMRRNSYSY